MLEYLDKYLDNTDKKNIKETIPLADRMRPKTLDDLVGQKDILGKDKLLYRMIKTDKLKSIILYGPPGCGKTSIANIIANTTNCNFKILNATTSGKKDIEEIINFAKDEQYRYGQKTILFIDEIHRFNKTQQDFLLPFVEKGTIILIGATTENPFFEVNKALLSRSTLFELKPIQKDDIIELIDKTLTNKENGLGIYDIVMDNETKSFLADLSNGDIRKCLNGLELAVLSSDDKKINITKDVIKECIQSNIVYDKDGDEHYNTISAFIKSMRGSDPDATVYYLGRMLMAGEDIKFIARRIIICAAEDVGLANPNALIVATNASLAVERIGMPEARIILSEAALYVALSKKSNSAYLAIDNVLNYLKNNKLAEIPKHLRDTHYSGSEKFNNGTNYKYPHNYENHYVEQQYLPDDVNELFYKPVNQGIEEKLI